MKHVAAVLIAFGLAACAPASGGDAGLQVAFINAPADERVSFLADELQQETQSLSGCCNFAFIRPAPVRFRETHSDLFGSRAAPQSASIARNLGAQVAVMVSAPRFERSVVRVDGGLEINGTVQLQATAIDASSGRPLGSVGSLSFSGSRFSHEGEPLPEAEEDPLMVTLTREAVADLAPHLASLLRDLVPVFSGER